MTKPLYRTTRIRLASPWQFGLRTLLLLMASVSVLLLIMGLVGLIWSAALAWFLLLVAAHVIGNSWGTHARDEQTNQITRVGNVVIANRPAPLAADPTAVRLRQQAVFNWLDYTVIGAAAVLGGGLGGAALWAVYWSRTGYSAIVVGAVSSAVIGGFLGFLCVTFARVTLWAISDARLSAQPDRYTPHALTREAVAAPRSDSDSIQPLNG